MKHERAFLWLFLGWVGTGYLTAGDGSREQESIPDRELGLSKTSVFDTPTPDAVAPEASEPGVKPALSRPHEEAPPLIPHNVGDYLPITWEDNLCIECHLADETGASDGQPIPESHLSDLRNAPGRAGTSVVGARQVCVSCHVAQFDAEPLVENVFER